MSYLRRILIFASILLFAVGIVQSQMDEPHINEADKANLQPTESSGQTKLILKPGEEGLSRDYVAASRLEEKGDTLKVNLTLDSRWPGVIIEFPDGPVDASDYAFLTIPITNLSKHDIWLGVRLDNPKQDGKWPGTAIYRGVPAGETMEFRVPTYGFRVVADEHIGLLNMRTAPEPSPGFDPSKILRTYIFATDPKHPGQIEIGAIQLEGSVKRIPAKDFLPFIDEFGQYKHANWPGKTASVEDLLKQRETETRDLKQHPGPEDWNKWGGWEAGPKLKATGYFYATKREGKWWLVDPDGRLFFSLGVAVVGPHQATPVNDREDYFAWLPDKEDDKFAAAWRQSTFTGARSYYKDKTPYDAFSFHVANLIRVDGDQWFERWRERTHQRFRSWGFNTIGGWSDETLRMDQRTPYTVSIHYGVPAIQGSQGHWYKFPDVFDPKFRANVRKEMEAQKGKAAGDPWCIGFFVDNELSWGDDTSLAIGVLRSPKDQPTRVEMIKQLKEKYETIAKLNEAWQTQFESFDALVEPKGGFKARTAKKFLREFNQQIVNLYFKTVREEVKRVAPNQLYLGPRFAWVNEQAALAAGQYCDAVSYNLYRYKVDSFRLPHGLDKPVISGEFHFGALDRGLFHPGLKPVANQEKRAEQFKIYVASALKHPNIVGIHWFQYIDQAATGRGDGENYQIGLVDVADKPYAETIGAAREMSRKMYELRAGE